MFNYFFVLNILRLSWHSAQRLTIIAMAASSMSSRKSKLFHAPVLLKCYQGVKFRYSTHNVLALGRRLKNKES